MATSEQPAILSPDTVYREQQMSNLSHNEKIHLRNKKILCDLATGKTRSLICAEYQISQRQLKRILSQAREDLAEWYESIAKEGMVSLFRENSQDVFSEIKTLKTLRNQAEQPETKFDMTKDIITSLITYNKMIAEGPVLTKYRDLVEKMSRITQVKQQENEPV